MKNLKTRKNCSNSRGDAYMNNNCDLNDIENCNQRRETNQRRLTPKSVNEYLTKNCDGKYITDDGTEDADDINNDSDTSSSFSLQECMNEFRERRIRRTSLTQHRQEADKRTADGNNIQGTTEQELINQNLCNKEQERKCKPCKNGFCYCFTSDSGDGGGKMEGCHIMGNLQNRNSRRSKRLETCKEISNSDKKTSNSLRSKEESKNPPSQVEKPALSKTNYLKSTSKTTNGLKAISSLETTTKDSPLIHIIQELRDNCVISKVKVNRDKMKLYADNLTQNKTTSHKVNYAADARNEHGIYSPTAPMMEEFRDVESNVSKTIKGEQKNAGRGERRHNAGGLLLKKRLSMSQLSYKPRDISKPPPKPPRISFCYGDKYGVSSASSSSSVREAEIVVDNFLAKRGFNVNVEKNKEGLLRDCGGKNSTKFESPKINAQRQIPNGTKERQGNISAKYPSLSDMERIAETKKQPFYDKNITNVDNVTKAMSVGWNEAKIKDMLNYDINAKQGEFSSMSIHAQPQQNPSSDIVGNENSIGWQIPQKINLDTVDGIVHHNLASNFVDKNTPVKEKIISPMQKSNERSREPKFVWSEHLKHLSPWSNKLNVKYNNNSKRKLRSSPKAFIISSKKKFLRFVSPKKGNGVQSYKPPYRNVGVQTLPNDIAHDQTIFHNQYQRTSSPQSPPGSYHSPMSSSHTQCPSLMQSQDTTTNETEAALFDFARTIHSPQRSSNRKLNFPLNYTFSSNEGTSPNAEFCASLHGSNHKKTYRSFNSELDQDVSISKLSYILSNIRTKLEANDQEAVRTFVETGFDCPDSLQERTVRERVELHKHSHAAETKHNDFNDPIYSEIEDNGVFLSESPELENHSAVQHYVSPKNPDVFYAKVNKNNKLHSDTLQIKEQRSQLPLAKIMKDSLKSKKVITNFIPLPTLPEPSGSEGTCYSLPLSANLPLSHYHSLNNVRVMEHNSPPKNLPYHSKSDLSLHRSQIFLENLYKSELMIDAPYQQKNFEKVDNGNRTISNVEYSMSVPSPNDVSCMSNDSDQYIAHNDSVSYVLPNDEVDAENYTIAGSNVALNAIAPPSSNNQSTPKKQSFVTKDNTITKALNIDADVKETNYHLYNSCPTTPSKQGAQYNPSRSLSMNEVTEYESTNKLNTKPLHALEKCNSFKSVLQNSFRKSKSFLKRNGKRLSTPLNFSMNNRTASPDKQLCTDCDLNLEELLSLNESATVDEQIAQTVSVCRKLPDLEISTEMVEAERLLLYSTLLRENQLVLSYPVARSHKPHMRFFIDDIFLPVIPDVNGDIFFNYFYIITFECGGAIKSTQSSECVDGTAVFRDNGMEFIYSTDLEIDALEGNNPNAIKCNIFMLRLRKISTATIERKKRTINETPSATLKSTTSSATSSSSLNDVVSRFRLQASFSLDAKDFVPFEYVHKESINSDRICIRSSSFCTRSLAAKTKSTNLLGQVRLKGRTEVRLPKHTFEGFLNVEDPHQQHNWNRRWCTLDGIFLNVWQDKSSLNTSPLLAIDLRDTNSPLTCSPRELCARPRSFSLHYITDKPCKSTSSSSSVFVFFSADTQQTLDDWLKHLNIVFDFITTWLK